MTKEKVVANGANNNFKKDEKFKNSKKNFFHRKNSCVENFSTQLSIVPFRFVTYEKVIANGSNINFKLNKKFENQKKIFF